MRNRDLEVHECLVVFYMLRHTCGAVPVPTSWLALPVLVLGILSRFSFYRERDALERRAYVLFSVVICLLLLHQTHDTGWASVIRLTLYICATRHIVLHKHDPWDAVAQCIWLLSVPYYALCLFIFQLNDMVAIASTQPYLKRRSSIWTSKGIAEDIV